MENESKKYWENVKTKTDSIMELLKGCTFEECKSIISSVNSTVKNKIGNTKL